MKTPADPRHHKRREAVQALFALGFGRKQPATNLSIEITGKLPAIDKIIKSSAPLWPISKINRVDLAILRLGVYELVFARKEPPKVIIDEAIELAKEYGSQKSPGFINGVLGAAIKKS
ncbi:transcription antitermination factor NusB [Candidatus Shapirobacteria bacterium]|nr:transcription antitermination factor NusB [Candidatus Shapirobacteria bacterium]